MSSFNELLILHDLVNELDRRKKHPFTSYVPLESPENNQKAFHQSDKWFRCVFGGNRSGKSRVSAQEIMWYGTHTHPYVDTPKSPRIWVIAPEYRVIYEGIWGHIRDNLPDWEVEKLGPKVPNWNIPSYIKFKKGGQIDFISAEGGESDRKKVQAAEIDLLCIDEEIGGDLWDELEMRLLTRGGRIVISATLVSSEEWLLEYERKGEQGDPDVGLFRLDTRKNTYNNQKALARILARLSDDEKEVRIYGRSRKTKGIIYKNFGRDNLITNREFPWRWPRYMIFDPGARIAAALWVVITPQQKRIVYREMYLHNPELFDCVEWWRANEDSKEEFDLRLIDMAAFKRHADGSIGAGDQLNLHYGYSFAPGINNKNKNIEDVRWLLQPPDDPKLLVIEENCPNFIGEMKKYRWKPDRLRPDKDSAPSKPLKKHDHLVNCIEYFASQDLRYIQPQTERDLMEKEAVLEDHLVSVPEDREERRNHRIAIIKARQRIKNREIQDW